MYNENVSKEGISLIRKYTNLVKKYNDGISLAIGEPCIKVDQRIIDKTKEALDDNLYTYTSAQGDNELIECICKKENVCCDNVLVTLGSSEGIFISLLTLLNKDDEVIIITPCYPQYSPVVRFCGGKEVYVDTSKTNFIPTYDDLISAITNKTKAIIVNSPANPTGVSYSNETLKMINDLAIKNNFFILSDDVYEQIFFKNKSTFKFDLNNTISLKSFSKTYGMTGYRLGYIIANKDTISQLLKVHSYIAISAPIFTQKAGIEALNIDNIDYSFLHNNLKIITSFLNDNNIEYIDINGGIFLFVSIKKYNMTSIEFCDKLLEKYHVACVPGDAFLASDYIRINFAINSDKLFESLQRIQEFIVTLER